MRRHDESSQDNTNSAGKRLSIVSNRLPVSLQRTDGKWAAKPSAGGLVTALGPVLRNRGGLWMGWPGVYANGELGDVLQRETDGIGYTLVPVTLSEEEVDQYYLGFSNEILWPLFHGLQSLCNYDPAYWDMYQVVNRKFAETVLEHSRADDYLWVHDYQLMNVGRELRELGSQAYIGFFLHIPFPPPDIYQKLPWRLQILESLLHFDLVGFQTQQHKRNFLNCVRSMLGGAEILSRGPISLVRTRGREVRVGAFPIGIDYESFANHATSPEVDAQCRRLNSALRNRALVLGVDRLDYTKGIPYKLDAFRTALETYPELRHKINLIQIVVPSRQVIPKYEELKEEIERKVSEINGHFAEPGWVPVQYIFRSVSRTELVAYYRTCQMALITPLEDGMNLVAKEYCACSVDGNNVLLLSEFAGAATQLSRGALMVNPYDRRSVADAIYQAYKMDPEERRERMERLKRAVSGYDVFRWVNAFLRAGAERLSDFPRRGTGRDVRDVQFWWEGA